MSMLIYHVLNDMSDCLSLIQLKRLQEVLLDRLSENSMEETCLTNEEYVERFIETKRVEGCSERTLKLYENTVFALCREVASPLPKVSTAMVRDYLRKYQIDHQCSKVTIDNLRRNLSSFFSWMEEERYIMCNPIRRIHKIKTGTTVREIISDECIEILRDACDCARDLAVLDFLYSTGIRVGELVKLDIADLNFEERECIVYGKGDKERKVYFDARAKIHILDYLKERTDSNPALFVSLYRPYKRIGINGIESRLRNLGKEKELEQIHPHKFRRTFATRAIDKGMPIEQVQKILGHKQIDTTLKYAMVSQSNVKASHRRIIS